MIVALAEARDSRLASPASLRTKGRWIVGLLSRLAGLAPAKAPSDDALLIHAMFLMAGADGNFDDEEISVIRGFANSLPEFKNTTEQEFQALIGEATRLAHDFF